MIAQVQRRGEAFSIPSQTNNTSGFNAVLQNQQQEPQSPSPGQEGSGFVAFRKVVKRKTPQEIYAEIFNEVTEKNKATELAELEEQFALKAADQPYYLYKIDGQLYLQADNGTMDRPTFLISKAPNGGFTLKRDDEYGSDFDIKTACWSSARANPKR